jgi:hypothetical protein
MRGRDERGHDEYLWIFISRFSRPILAGDRWASEVTTAISPACAASVPPPQLQSTSNAAELWPGCDENRPEAPNRSL